MALGRFARIDIAINEFIHVYLGVHIFNNDCSYVIGLRPIFATFLTANGVDALAAEEHAERHIDTLKRSVERVIAEWRGLSLAPPFGFLATEDTLITWRHDTHEKIIGERLASPAYVDACSWIRSAQNREFLYAIGYFLFDMGCDPIYITDGVNDCGVDLLGSICDGHFRRTSIFVQAKTLRNDRISLETVLQEYGKYKALPATEAFRRYLRLIRCEESVEGGARIYMFCSNSEFRSAAVAIASQVGIMLRSGRQIAGILSGEGRIIVSRLTEAVGRGDIAITQDTNIVSLFRRMAVMP